MTAGWRRWKGIWRRAPEHEVDAELGFHFDERVAELVGRGASTAAARTQAMAEFGDLRTVRRDLVTIDQRVARQRSMAERWEWVAQDLGYVVRSLRRSPGFVLTVALTLAFGLGVNTAIFSLLDRLFLSTPPGITNAANVRRVVRIDVRPAGAGAGQPAESVTPVFPYPAYEALRDALAPETLAGYDGDHASLGQGDSAETVGVQRVLGNFFGLLGVRPQVGRFFSADELRPERPTPVVVIGDALWHTRYRNRPDIVGTTLQLDGQSYTVIGVAAAGFHGSENDAADAWIPMNMEGMPPGDPHWYQGTRTFFISMFTAIVPTQSVGRIETIATSVFRHDTFMHDSLARARVGSLAALSLTSEFNTGEMRIATRLGGVALIILLIAGANVANLLTVRGLQRRPEIAVRLALGVTRRRLVALLLMESLVVAAIGGAAAVVGAIWAARQLRHLVLPDVRWADAPINIHVLGFALCAVVAIGVLSGLAPAVQASRADLTGALKGGQRSGERTGRIRSTLLVTQVVLCTVLLAGTGLLVRSLHSVETEDLGYDGSHVVFASVTADREFRERGTDVTRRLPDLARTLGSIPGVVQVALAGNAPMRGISFEPFYFPGRDTLHLSTRDGPFVAHVSPEFFAATGMRVVRGRTFLPGEHAEDARALIVDENMARHYWPGQDPLTQCMILGATSHPCTPVVGVVSNTHYMGIVENPSMHYYLPLSLGPMPEYGTPTQPGVIVLLASPGQVARVVADVTHTLKDAFAGWATPRVWRMDEDRARELHPYRTGAALFAAAGLLALLVAVVGIYSTISYSVSRRTREIGVRMALGASPGGVAALVVREGARVVLIGIVVGTAVALLGGRIVASMLYHTSTRDPLVLGTVALVLLGVALAASLVPALRALRVDPAIALRSE